MIGVPYKMVCFVEMFIVLSAFCFNTGLSWDMKRARSSAAGADRGMESYRRNLSYKKVEAFRCDEDNQEISTAIYNTTEAPEDEDKSLLDAAANLLDETLFSSKKNSTEPEPLKTLGEVGYPIRICFRATSKAESNDVHLLKVDDFTFLKYRTRGDVSAAGPNRQIPKIIRQRAVDHGIPLSSHLTEVICNPGSDVCAVETTLTGYFFLTAGTIYGRGTVLMQRGKDESSEQDDPLGTRSRSLQHIDTFEDVSIELDFIGNNGRGKMPPKFRNTIILMVIIVIVFFLACYTTIFCGGLYCCCIDFFAAKKESYEEEYITYLDDYEDIEKGVPSQIEIEIEHWMGMKTESEFGADRTESIHSDEISTDDDYFSETESLEDNNYWDVIIAAEEEKYKSMAAREPEIDYDQEYWNEVGDEYEQEDDFEDLYERQDGHYDINKDDEQGEHQDGHQDGHQDEHQGDKQGEHDDEYQDGHHQYQQREHISYFGDSDDDNWNSGDDQDEDRSVIIIETKEPRVDPKAKKISSSKKKSKKKSKSSTSLKSTKSDDCDSKDSGLSADDTDVPKPKSKSSSSKKKSKSKSKSSKTKPSLGSKNSSMITIDINVDEKSFKKKAESKPSSKSKSSATKKKSKKSK